MKAVVATRYGPPDVLHIREIPDPVPKDNEVLIRIYATTVTAGDCELRRFDFPVLMWLPLRMLFGIRRPKNPLGQEFAGVIEAMGKDVKQFRPGDPVFAPTSMSLGAYAEYICLPATSAIAVKPDNLTFEEAAAVPTGGLNAVYFVKRANIQRGEKVLINGAGGSIGTFAVQLAKYFGAEVTAVDNTEKLEMLRTIGADHVIDYTEEDFAQSGERYDVILDVVGKGSLARKVRALASGGRYLSANPGLSIMVRGMLTLLASSRKVSTGVADYKVEDLFFLKELLESGTIKPVIDRRYPLEELAEAHRYVETGQKRGCVVITVGGGRKTV